MSGKNPNGTEPTETLTTQDVKIGEYTVKAKVNEQGVPVQMEMPEGLEGKALEDFQTEATNVVNMKASSTQKYSEAAKMRNENSEWANSLTVREQAIAEREQQLLEKIGGKTNKTVGHDQKTPGNFKEFLAQNKDRFGSDEVAELIEEDPTTYHEAMLEFQSKQTESLIADRMKNFQATAKQESSNSLLNNQILNDPDITAKPAEVEKWCQEREYKYNGYGLQAYKALNQAKPDPIDTINKIESNRKSALTFVKKGNINQNYTAKKATYEEMRRMTPEQLAELDKQNGR